VKKSLLLCVLWLSGAAGFAEERTYTFLFTDDFTYQKSRLANTSDQFYNSSSLFLKYGNWAGGLTLRSYNYFKQATDFTLQNPEYDLYRKYIQYTNGNFELQAGDFHSMLGRGLVLSILQNDKAYRDRTVLGGDFRFHSKKWQIRTLGGRVEDELKEQKWDVAGAEVSREYWKGNRMGFNASYIHDAKTFLSLDDRLTWSVSWSADRLPGGLNYYAEISRLHIRDSFGQDGSAYYSNVGWTRKNATFLFEFKKYKDFDNGLNNPPSADRGDEGADLLDSETLRLYSQYSFFNPNILAFFSIGRVWESGVAGPQIYTGASASELWGRLDLSGGYSYKETYYPVKIVDAQATFRLTTALAAGFSLRDKRLIQGNYRFTEKDWMPQISWSPYGSVFFQKQYSRNLIDGHHYFNSYGCRINVRRDSYFEFSIGRVRGGEVCASGQCLYLPPFRGWKVGAFATIR
jgi:hypothetical protein